MAFASLTVMSAYISTRSHAPLASEVLLTGIAQLATPHPSKQRGDNMRKLIVLEDAAMLLRAGHIVWVGRASDAPSCPNHHDLGQVAVIPALVDPHTHAVWAGDRLADFEARVAGVPYEQILARGGGIRSTMRATAAASVAELVDLARPRLAALLASGATTIEVKSGYGLHLDAEERMLQAIALLSHEFAGTLYPTLLIHVPPTEDRATYVEEVCRQWIPALATSKLIRAVDVFCEKEAFSLDETRQILMAARFHDLDVKLHADQFHPLGGTELACQLGALSVDHLEASTQAQIMALAQSETVATILPGVTLHLGLAAAAGRALIDAGAAVAIGTDLNPGSSPLFSAQMALALAVRLCGLTPAEALSAGTVNAAAALHLDDRGALAPGQRADFLVLEGQDWRNIAYGLGHQVIKEVWISGQKVQMA